jgi:hypothetical protein
MEYGRWCHLRCVCFRGGDEVGLDRVIFFFQVFGIASSVIVNKYLFEMLDDSVPNIFRDELILSLFSHHFSVRP